MTGTSRFGSAEHHSIRKSLYACTHASISSGSFSLRKPPEPKPPTFG